MSTVLGAAVDRLEASFQEKTLRMGRLQDNLQAAFPAGDLDQLVQYAQTIAPSPKFLFDGQGCYAKYCRPGCGLSGGSRPARAPSAIFRCSHNLQFRYLPPG